MHIRTLIAGATGVALALSPLTAWAESAESLYKSKCLHCHAEEVATSLPAGTTWSEYLDRHRAKAPWLISADDAVAVANYLDAVFQGAAGRTMNSLLGATAPAKGGSTQVVISPAGQLHAAIVNPRVTTAEGSLASAELMLSGLPFFEKMAQQGLPLDGEVASITSGDAFWYSRYNLEAISVQSRMGLPLVYAHNIELQAAEDGVSSQEYLDGMLETFRTRTGVDEIPQGLDPIYAEFESGAPFLQELPDFADLNTLKWDTSKFDKNLSTAGLGFAMVNQTLWASYLLGSTHGEDLFGNDGKEGFLGALLLTQVVNKVYLLLDELAFDGTELGSVNPFAYEATPKYFPRKYGVEIAYDEMSGPPKPARYTVADTSSQALDQAALLWGASELYYMSDPKIEDPWDALFGSPADGALFAPEVHNIARGLIQVVTKNLVAMHFDATKKTFVSSWDNGERGDTLKAADAGILLVALARAHEALHDDESTRAFIEDFIRWQADYLNLNMQQRDGGFVEAINVKTAAQSTVPRTLLAQSLAIRGLLAAYGVTGNEDYKNSALTAYEFMESSLWSPATQVYRTSEGSDLSLHTPMTVGATLGALRELTLATSNKQTLDRFKSFFTEIIKKNGMQMAELDEAGETSTGTKDALLPDVDGDGVRKPAFAGGPFGAAPVLASQVQVPTP